MEIKGLTISKAHEGLKNGEFSSVELAKAHLEEIKKTDGEIGAFLLVTEALALSQAKQADSIIAQAQGKEFPMLTGIPCAIKDNILVHDQKCTAGSKILEEYVAPYDATVITRLKKAGAVILGKTNLDEFAMGASTENSAFKITKNPHDTTRVAGGSSGGSAAAVAADQAVFSLGSDTGGSIRLPASFCGVVGLNPTYGAVSRYGAVALASSLDQIGPIAKTIEDTIEVFKAISGKDSLDATSADFNFQPSTFSLKGARIGIPKEYFGKGMDAQVELVIRRAIEHAKKQGAEIMPISLPHTEYSMACYYIIVPCEASANLARYDGMRYGLHKHGENLLDMYLQSRGAGFGAEPKRRILIGTHALSSGYYDAYYKKAQEVRGLIRQDFIEAFKKVDLIFSPVAPFPAFKVGEKSADPLSMYLVDVCTGAVKLAGLPALSLPAGKAEKLPVGLQIIGNHFEESKILAVAAQMEKMLQ